MAALLILLVIGIPWVGAVIVWRIGDRRPALLHTMAVIFSVAAGLAATALLFYSSDRPAIQIDAGSAFGTFTFVPDGLAVFLTAIATIVGSLAVVFSVDYMQGETGLSRYYALVLFFIGAMTGLVLTTNLLLVFGFWEITALCSYALISFYNDDPKAVAGGMKALIMTQLGGVGLLLGALLIYAYTGSFDLQVFLAQAHTLPSAVLSVAGFGLLIAAAAKSAQFPFQTWLPDAMEAPTPISALIHAATMVNAGVYLLARFYPAFENVPGWRTAVIATGVLSALLAALMALVATDLKRVLAYSTVSQLGYMVYAIGAGGVFASQFHLLSHSVFKALLFLGAGAVIHAVKTRDMREMGGLGNQMPLVRNVFIIGALALAGLPFLNGFWSKELVLEAGLAHGPLWAFIAMLVGAGLTALYTFRCVWLVFFASPRAKEIHAHDALPAMKVSLTILAAGTFTTWLLSGPFAKILEETLPFHTIGVVTTIDLVIEILTAPATLLALAVIALGLAGWWWRSHLSNLVRLSQGIADAAANSFGFEGINSLVVKGTQSTAEAVRVLQTGVLSWNVFAILAGLVIVILLLGMGASL